MRTTSQILPKRWWDIPSAILLIAIVITSANRLNATEWTNHLTITQSIIVIACIFGMLLGYSRFSGKTSLLFAILYGAFFVTWQLGLTVEIDRANLLWSDRLINIADRLRVVIFQIITNEIVYDSILFLVIMSVLFWVIGISAGYNLIRRGNPWQALIPIGITLIVIQSFDPLILRRSWYIAFFIFFGLILIARNAYIHNLDRWQESKTALPPQLGFDFIRFSLYATGSMVLIAWAIPTLTTSFPGTQRIIQPLKQEWNELQQNLDNVFASLRSTVASSSDYFGNTLTLGRGNVLSDKIIFRGQTEQRIPEGVNLYWRARVYDIFDGNQWYSSATEKIQWDPDSTEILNPVYEQRWESDFTILSEAYFKTPLSPSQLLWINRIGEFDVIRNPDETTDFTTFHSELSLRPGNTYQVRSALSQATVYNMRNSSNEYPEWITSRYLQLPSTTSTKTIGLAEKITEGLNNPYDKTTAIINYLRDNIKYEDIIPEPPPNKNLVDWFLFDQQEGFCNYYASAAVIMLRSIGIPARFAVGFASGEEIDDDQFVVKQKEAHAWPEVYFNEYGWVEFEPTSSRPVSVHLPGGENLDNNLNGSTGADPFLPPTPMMEDDRVLTNDLLTLNNPADNLTKFQWFLIISLPLIIITIITIYFYKYRSNKILPIPVFIENSFHRLGYKPPAAIQRWSQITKLPLVMRSYLEINKALIRLDNIPDINWTPSERAGKLIEILPPSQSAVEKLINEYQLGLFSSRSSDEIVAKRAGNEIRSLSFSAYINKVLLKFKFRKNLSKKKLNKKVF